MHDPSNRKLLTSRERFALNAGMYVSRKDTVYQIERVIDFETVLGIEVVTGRSEVLNIRDLGPVDNSDDDSADVDLSSISESEWDDINRRLEAIQPLIDHPAIGRTAVQQRAEEFGVGIATLYRWLRKYRATSSGLALLPKKRGWKTGKKRLGLFTEQVIQEVIKEFYLTPQRPTIHKTFLEIRRRCYERNIKPPSLGAVRLRLSRIPERERLRGRGYKEKAKYKFRPAAGTFPGADYPLAVVQIDHSRLDIELVDDTHRKAIGRPWLTLAVDVHSRMVVGYYLAFDAPSETSIAMCVAHAMLPKEEWLLLHKIDVKWPVWGTPKKIHVDNAAEFRSDTFRKACLAYNINLEFRPVGQPHHGGTVERLFGTIAKEIHALPGTTFDSVKSKEGYDSEKNAAMTKSEFERWLVTFICKVYHERPHSKIGTSPLKKWEIGIFGNGAKDGVGLPPMISNRQKVLLDFLPTFYRTVQPTGVTIEGMTYYAEALRPWINAVGPDTPGKKRVFAFRRDPRDVSTIWFWDPLLGQYCKIPCADQSLPIMSVWEFERIKTQLREQGIKSVNENVILRGLTELRNQVEESKGKTRKVRREAQRHSDHRKAHSPANPQPTAEVFESKEAAATGFVDGDVSGFGELA